jgi:general secretion pathway protein L
VDDLLIKLRDLGISPDIITTQAADGDTLPVNLLPQSTRPTRRFSVPRLNTVLAGIAVLLLVTAMLLPPLLGKRTLEDLQQQLQVAEAAAADGLALRRDVERLTLASTFLVTKKKTTVPVLQMLAEVSRILPDDTWLTRVDVNGPELQLRGQSSAAAALIELLESSALFRDARFRSPVVQVPATNSERFHLSVVLETPEAT